MWQGKRDAEQVKKSEGKNVQKDLFQDGGTQTLILSPTHFIFGWTVFTYSMNRLVGIVVRCLPWQRKIPGSNPACAGIFSGSSHTSDSKIGTPVATLPGTWHDRVSTGTGRPGVNILWLGEVESLICSYYLSVAARKIVWADPSLRYTSMLLGR